MEEKKNILVVAAGEPVTDNEARLFLVSAFHVIAESRKYPEKEVSILLGEFVALLGQP